MRCSVFIATSADGYIATGDGDVSWLETSGDATAELGDNADMGFEHFFSSVDCMIMGRKTMEKLSSFNLTAEQWPYGDTPIFVISQSQNVAPDNLRDHVIMCGDTIDDVVADLRKKGFTHAYVDGGALVTAFLNLGLINEMTITQAPILLGEGIPLFGHLTVPVHLEQAQVKAYANGFVQKHYLVATDLTDRNL